MVLGKLGTYTQKNEIESLSFSIHKNQHKANEKFKQKTSHIKSSRRKPVKNLRLTLAMIFFVNETKSTGEKSKITKKALHKSKTFCSKMITFNKMKRKPTRMKII